MNHHHIDANRYELMFGFAFTENADNEKNSIKISQSYKLDMILKRPLK